MRGNVLQALPWLCPPPPPAPTYLQELKAQLLQAGSGNAEILIAVVEGALDQLHLPSQAGARPWLLLLLQLLLLPPPQLWGWLECLASTLSPTAAALCTF